MLLIAPSAPAFRVLERQQAIDGVHLQQGTEWAHTVAGSVAGAQMALEGKEQEQIARAGMALLVERSPSPPTCGKYASTRGSRGSLARPLLGRRDRTHHRYLEIWSCRVGEHVASAVNYPVLCTDNCEDDVHPTMISIECSLQY